MIFDGFLNVLAGLYTIRMIWNHGHRAEAVALLAVAAVVKMAELPLTRLLGDLYADVRRALGWSR